MYLLGVEKATENGEERWCELGQIIVPLTLLGYGGGGPSGGGHRTLGTSTYPEMGIFLEYERESYGVY